MKTAIKEKIEDFIILIEAILIAPIIICVAIGTLIFDFFYNKRWKKWESIK